MSSSRDYHNNKKRGRSPTRDEWQADKRYRRTVNLFKPSLLEKHNHVPNVDTLPDLPDLDKEITRHKYITKLRQFYENILQIILDVPVPKLSFERWLSERSMRVDLSGKEKIDPVIPSADIEPVVSGPLFREISEDIPVKVNMFPRSTTDAVESLTKWVNAAKKLATLSLPPIGQVVSKIDVKGFDCEEALNGVEDIVNTASEELASEEITKLTKSCDDSVIWAKSIKTTEAPKKLIDKIKELQGSVGQVLQNKLKSRVELVCILLARVSGIYLRRVADSPNQMDIQSQYKSVIIEDKKYNLMSFTYGGLDVVVNNLHYEKLKALFNANCHFDWPALNGCIFAMLLRYETCLSPFLPKKGSGLHAALTGSTFHSLQQLFGVNGECFASPLNCYYGVYCSAFYDTDAFFGSSGSFFNFNPKSGSFEVNPPFVEELIYECAGHMDYLLKETTEPLSFIVFIPNWEDSFGLQRIVASTFNRHTFVLDAYKHKYVSGLQHQEDTNSVQYKAVHATKVIFLQNDSAFAKWKPTSRTVESLIQNTNDY